MATDKNTIKDWFRTGLKPTQAQFWAWMDSYWHKEEKIPITAIDDIENILNEKADAEALINHLNDEAAHGGLLNIKEDKANKGIAEGYAPLDETVKLPSDFLNIVDNLEDGGAEFLASAETVKTLKGYINAINTILTSDDVNLDTVQELVDSIKVVETSLATILVNDLTTGGVTKALTAEQGKALKTLIDNLPTSTLQQVTSQANRGLLNGKNFQGTNAGVSAFNADYSNFLGHQAGYLSTNAYYSNFFGGAAGSFATNANNSNFFGNSAGNSATNANSSNFFGVVAGYGQTNASYSTFIGSFVASTDENSFNILGTNNIIIGTNITLPTGSQDRMNIGGILYGFNTRGNSNDLLNTPTANASSTGRLVIGNNIDDGINRLQVNGTIKGSPATMIDQMVTLAQLTSAISNSIPTIDQVLGAGNSTSKNLTVNNVTGNYIYARSFEFNNTPSTISAAGGGNRYLKFSRTNLLSDMPYYFDFNDPTLQPNDFMTGKIMGVQKFNINRDGNGFFSKLLLGTSVDNSLDTLIINGTASGSPATQSNQFVTKAQLDSVSSNENTCYFSADFLLDDAKGNYPFNGTQINGGTAVAVAGSENHPGVVRIYTSVTGGSGYRYITAQGGTTANSNVMSLVGGATYTQIIRPWDTPNGRVYGGFHNSINQNIPTTGVYFEYGAIAKDGKLWLITNNGGRVGTLLTTLAGNWYKMKFTINSTKTAVLAQVFNDVNQEIVNTGWIFGNMPVGQQFAAGIVCTFDASGYSSALVLEIDHINFSLPNLVR